MVASELITSSRISFSDAFIKVSLCMLQSKMLRAVMLGNN